MKKNFFDLENNFYKLVPFSRIEKFVIQLELFKKSLIAKGDIIEFGVYKGNSLIRLISFNKIFNQKKKFLPLMSFINFRTALLKKMNYIEKDLLKKLGKIP